LQSVGFNTQLLATLRMVISFVDTPAACGGVVHCRFFYMINLSYPICRDTPMYGGGGPETNHGKRISKGDSCNTLEMAMTSHTGTHIDFPAHFDAVGKTLTDYSPGFWFSERIECLFMDKMNKMDMDNAFLTGKLVDSVIIEQLISDDINNSDTEEILLKTGIREKREFEIYWKEPPGIDPKLPDFLREMFPRLRFFGMDLISVSSFANRKAGIEAHKAFLKHSHPILPIEDMNLCSLPEILFNMLIAPLYIKNADGVPCTIFANIGL
jgi:arylformamidase